MSGKRRAWFQLCLIVAFICLSSVVAFAATTIYTYDDVNRVIKIETGQEGGGPQEFSISGTVTSGGNPLSGVTMTLSGDASATTTTNASGNFSFTGLANGQYTITPSKLWFTFSPADRAVTVNGANKTNQNFTATPVPTYTISGAVTAGGSALSGVTMTLSGNGADSIITDANGNYSFTVADGNYTITPSKTGCAFTPPNRSVAVSGANVIGQNFTATFSISGTVTTSGIGSGSPLQGVAISLSGAATGTTTTDTNGNYTFVGLSNGSYTVTPSKTGYSFAPANMAVTLSGSGAVGRNFTGTLTGYSISGTVTSGPTPLSGVTMTLSGAASSTTTTDASGNYSFTGLANGSYTVTPGKTGYTFTPANRAVTVSSANVTAQNFTATAVVATYSISGTVRSAALGSGEGTPLSGVTMTLAGAASATTTTDASGNYSFTGLANGNYTVTPSRAGYTFTPVNRAVTISSANMAGQNFTAQVSAATYSISGTVTFGGNALSGVTMTLAGAASSTTTTDASGNYSFTGLANGSYTVTPAKTGYTFTPASRAVTISSANVTGQNFLASAVVATYSISGTVRSAAIGSGGGTPLSGVTITLGGPAGGTTTTNASGVYTFAGLANGSYTATPSQAGYTFTPVSRTVVINNANATGQDFTRN